MRTAGLARMAASLLTALPLAGWALCTSDGTAQPQVLLERFVSADCESCWKDPATPGAAPGTLALDWVVPGTRGDDAPLSAVALPEALDRLAQLARTAPSSADAATTRRTGGPVNLRVAQGAVFNDYVGVSIALRPPGRQPWQTWLLLVESLPAGTEGSPVPRNLVRNVFQPGWNVSRARTPAQLEETRSMRIAEGAQADRLRLVGLVHDGRGRLAAMAMSDCRP